jgi:hypothetical protein
MDHSFHGHGIALHNACFSIAFRYTGAAVFTCIPIVHQITVLILDGMVWAKPGTGLAPDATIRVEKDFRMTLLRFRVGTPGAMQRTPLKKNQGSNPRAVMERKSLNIENDPFRSLCV